MQASEHGTGGRREGVAAAWGHEGGRERTFQAAVWYPFELGWQPLLRSVLHLLMAAIGESPEGPRLVDVHIFETLGGPAPGEAGRERALRATALLHCLARFA